MNIVIDYNGFADRFSEKLRNIEDDISVRIIENGAPGSNLCNATDTPFATNPNVTYGGQYLIVYNPDFISKCELFQSEQDACLLHEIGHILNKDENLDEVFKEIQCDNFAVKAGLAIALMNAIIKMNGLSLIDDVNAELRIRNIAKQINLFRPEWVSGRFNIQKNVAICYNLVEGMSYFFEEDSSIVISLLLELERNTCISLEELSMKSELHVINLVPFILELINLRLVTLHVFSENEILLYRSNIAEKKHIESNLQQRDSSDINFDDAEHEYSKAIEGVTSVMFELTYRCSEKCIHCYNIGSSHNDSETSQRGKRTELSLQQLKSIVDQLCDNGMFRACLTGGDPFANQHVWEIMEYLKEKNVVFDVYTNGQQLVGNEYRLANLYPKTVGISIYSAIPEIHDSITRVKGSLLKSLTVMENLSKLAIPMYLKCCVMRTNFDSYTSVYEIAEKFSAFAQIEVNVTDSVDGNKYVSKNLRLSEEQYNVVLQDKRIPLYVGKEGTMRTIIPRSSDANLCKAGKKTFNVTPDGKLIPCCRFHLEIGDLKVSTLAEILSHNSILNKWLSVKVKDYEECGRHNYCDFCNVCPGLNYSEHNTPLKAAENACFLAKIRYNMAVKIGVINRTEMFDS